MKILLSGGTGAVGRMTVARLVRQGHAVRVIGEAQNEETYVPHSGDFDSSGGGGSGLHWESPDEDISVDGLLLGVGDRSRT